MSTRRHQPDCRCGPCQADELRRRGWRTESDDPRYVVPTVALDDETRAFVENIA